MALTDLRPTSTIRHIGTSLAADAARSPKGMLRRPRPAVRLTANVLLAIGVVLWLVAAGPSLAVALLTPFGWVAHAWSGDTHLAMHEQLPVIGTWNRFDQAALATATISLLAWGHGRFTGNRKRASRFAMVGGATTVYLALLATSLPYIVTRTTFSALALTFIFGARLFRPFRPAKTVLFFIGVAFTCEALAWSLADDIASVTAFAMFSATAAFFTRIDVKRRLKTTCFTLLGILAFLVCVTQWIGTSIAATGSVVAIASSIAAVMAAGNRWIRPAPPLVIAGGGMAIGIALATQALPWFLTATTFSAGATYLATQALGRRSPNLADARFSATLPHHAGPTRSFRAQHMNEPARNERPHNFETTPFGLSDLMFPHIEPLGRRGSRIVYHAPELESVKDPNSGLVMFAISAVFHDTSSVLIGCGTPNLATSVYDDATGKWKRLSAFMLYRERSHIAALDQLQVGVYFELRGLSSDVRARILSSMEAHAGMRAPSCAFLNARMLAAAGFSLGGGRDITKVVLPSRLAGKIWRYGLEHEGTPVDLRVVNTSQLEVSDHFVGVFRKEANSPIRMVKKALKKKAAKVESPVLPEQRVASRRSGWSGRPVTVWMNRPSLFGLALTLLWGRHAEFKVAIPGMKQSPRLLTPLESFPGKLSWMSKAKKHALFSRPVVAFINRIKNKSYDRYDNVPVDAAIEMMSPVGEETGHRVLWNFAVILSDDSYEIRLSPLKNLDPLSQQSKLRQVSNWILAKHVVATGYDPCTVYAGEAWVQRATDRSKLVLCVNDNSGTYKPTADQLAAVGDLFGTLGLDVRTVSHSH